MGMLKSNMGYFDFTLTYTANLLGSKKRRINIRPKYRHLVNVDKLVNVDQSHSSDEGEICRELQNGGLFYDVCKGVRCPPIFSLSNLIDAGWL